VRRLLRSSRNCAGDLRSSPQGTMRFSIVFTTDAHDDLRLFRKGERTKIINAIEELLSHDPAHETRNRKRLRPNQMGEWELRVDKL